MFYKKVTVITHCLCPKLALLQGDFHVSLTEVILTWIDDNARPSWKMTKFLNHVWIALNKTYGAVTTPSGTLAWMCVVTESIQFYLQTVTMSFQKFMITQYKQNKVPFKKFVCLKREKGILERQTGTNRG